MYKNNGLILAHTLPLPSALRHFCKNWHMLLILYISTHLQICPVLCHLACLCMTQTTFVYSHNMPYLLVPAFSLFQNNESLRDGNPQARLARQLAVRRAPHPARIIVRLTRPRIHASALSKIILFLLVFLRLFAQTLALALFS